VTARRGPQARSLHDVCTDALGVNCGYCWAPPRQPCVSPEPGGYHVARFGRAMRRSVISGTDLLAILQVLGPFTDASLYVDKTPGGAQ
jgi:hypothetical protein